MANKSLTFDLIGRDRSASQAMNGVGDTAFKVGQTVGKAGKAIAAGLAIGTAAAIAFGITSVKAFAEAETAQNKLTFAYEKFPALQDLRIEALRKYNSELALTTKYDDDATASAQAVLAQFQLSGSQIKKLTPLLQDYASATGKDLPDAAQDLGKALLGQGRALKAIGIEFEDGGDLLTNYDRLMGSLTEKVGGFAEREGQTAAGQMAILNNRFGEFQETIGEALLPGLTKLMDTLDGPLGDALNKVADWFSSEGADAIGGFVNWLLTLDQDAIPPAIIGIGLLTAAFLALDAAMWANPAGLIFAGVVLAIAEVVAVVVWLNQNMEIVNYAFYMMGQQVASSVNIAIFALNSLLVPLNAVIGAINWLTGSNLSTIYVSPLEVKGAPNVVLPASGGRDGGKAGAPFSGGTSRRMAEGGYVPAQPGGVFANIGEGRHDEIVLPLTDKIVRQIGGAGGGNTYINVPGGFIGSEDKLTKVLDGMRRRTQARGALSKGPR